MPAAPTNWSYDRYMTVSGRRLSPERLATALGVPASDLVVFGALPAVSALSPWVVGAWSSLVAGLALAVTAGGAGVVAGRRGYSAWQSGWYILVALAALLTWWIFAAVLALEFGLR
jgi:hypothetical protein